MKIDQFINEHAFLSNFYITPISFEGKEYASVEHAYQAAKTTNPLEHQKIIDAPTPGKAKRLGAKVSLRKDWESVKQGIMLELLRIKFSNPGLRQKLLDTGEAELIEGNNWGDMYWGLDLKTGKGFNFLGVLLMQVRKELLT